MESIEQMIKRLCPKGIEFTQLGEVCDIKTGKGITKKDAENAGDFPIISGGVTPMGYFHLFNREPNVVTVSRVGANAGWVGYMTEKFYLNDKCFSVIPNATYCDIINPKFLYYYLKQNESTLTSLQSEGGVPTINTQKVGSIDFPLPPIEIQSRIVEVLDKMTTLTAELEAELEARKQQYEYYRNKLLSFSEIGGGIRLVKLGEICEIGTGSHNTQDGLTEGAYPFYTRGIDILYMNNFDYDETAIITAGDGAGVGKVIHFVKGKYALHQRAYRIVADEHQVLSKYIYHYMRATFYNYIMRSSVSSSVTSIRKPMLNDYPVPLPSLEEQERIVSILDRFEALTTDLRNGLPAEIEARRQQYEYYRNKLLTFDKVA